MKNKERVLIMVLCVLFFTVLLYPDVVAQYKCGEPNISSNLIRPYFRIVNNDTTSIPLEEITLRYYFTAEGAANNLFAINYAAVGAGNITGSFHPDYLEIGFLVNTGTLLPWTNTGEIQVQIYKTDWSAYDQSDDYSFGPDITTYQDWGKVELYLSGVQIWPDTEINEPTPTPESKIVPQGNYSIEVDVTHLFSITDNMLVKYFGDYNGIVEAPFTIGPYPQPFEVYIVTTAIDIPYTYYNPYLDLYHNGITDGSITNYGIFKTTAKSTDPTKSITVKYAPYLEPTNSPTTAPTHSPYISLSTTVVDINTKEPLAGVDVTIAKLPDVVLIDTLVTDSSGVCSSIFYGINEDLLVTAYAPGYHTAESYVYVTSTTYTNTLTIECVPESESGPTPLPIFSPTPMTVSTYTPPPITVSEKVYDLVPEILDFHDPSGSFVNVIFPFTSPIVRAVDWGTPYIDGSVISVDVKLTKWKDTVDSIDYNNTICRTYDLGVLPLGESYTFVVKEYGVPIAEKIFIVEASPLGTLAPGEIVNDTTYEFSLIEEGEMCYADINTIFISGEGVSYASLWENRWSGLCRDGEVFSISTNFVRYTTGEYTDTSINQYSKRYSLGALTPGDYSIEMYAGGTLVKTVEFTVWGNTTPTPTPPANSSGRLWMEAGSSTITSGDIFTVNVHANLGLQYLGGWGVDINWSDLSIDYIGYKTGSSTITYIEQWPEYGRISLANDFSSTVSPSEDTILFTLIFKAIAASTPRLTLGINNLLTPELIPVGIPVGDAINLNISGEGIPDPIIDATPMPTATPITATPEPVEGYVSKTKQYYVYDSTIPGYPPIVGAFIETYALTDNAGYTDEYGFCSISNYADEAVPIDVTVSAVNFYSSNLSVYLADGQFLYEVGLLPDGSVTPPPVTPTVTPSPTPTPDICTYNIDGSVLDMETDLPIEGALVTLTSATNGAVSTYTDSEGYFSLTNESNLSTEDLVVFASGYYTIEQYASCGSNSYLIYMEPTEYQPGTIWIEPNDQYVTPETSFQLSIHLNSGDQKIAAYGMTIAFDSSVISPDTSIGTDSVEEGPDGFVAAVNAQTDGEVAISGFDVTGTGPGSDLHLLIINFIAGTEGETDVTIIVDSLVDELTQTIGTPVGIGAHISLDSYRLGDCNHDDSIDIIDALLTAQYYVGLNISTFYPSEADVSCDGNVDIIDALLIAQFYVGIISTFC